MRTEYGQWPTAPQWLMGESQSLNPDLDVPSTFVSRVTLTQPAAAAGSLWTAVTAAAAVAAIDDPEKFAIEQCNQ